MQKGKIFRLMILIICGSFLLYCVVDYFFSLNEMIAIHREDKVTTGEKLQEGIESGDIGLVKEAIEEDGKTDYGDDITPLSLSCSYSQEKVADYFLTLHKRSDYNQEQQNEILAEAICFMDKKFVEKLVLQGYRLNGQVVQKIYYKFHLTGQDSTRMERDVTDKNAVENIQLLKKDDSFEEDIVRIGDKLQEEHCLCYGLAMELSNIQDIYHQYLTNSTEKIDFSDEQQKQMLYLVSAFGTPEQVERLMKKKENLEVKDALGCSLLMIACQYGNIDMIEFLISQGLNANDLNNEDNNCLVESVLFHQYDSAEYLLSHHFVEISDDNELLFQYLINDDNVILLQLLQKYGLSINKMDVESNRFFYHGQGKNMLKYLLDTTDMTDETAVRNLAFWAVQANDIELLKKMQDKGIILKEVINRESSGLFDDKISLLDQAVQCNSYESIQFLYQNGVKKRYCKNTMKTSSTKIQKYLEKKGL